MAAKKATTSKATTTRSKATAKATATKQKASTTKAKKEAEPKKDTAPAVPGVRVGSKGRCWQAGQVLAKHGLAAGVTEAMEKELAKKLGRDPNAQDGFDLRQSWQAIRGYLEALGLETGLPATAEK